MPADPQVGLKIDRLDEFTSRPVWSAVVSATKQGITQEKGMTKIHREKQEVFSHSREGYSWNDDNHLQEGTSIWR